MTPDDPTFMGWPCDKGHDAVLRSDGWVYCRRCGKKLYKGPDR